MIIRTKHKENFTVLSNKMLSDKRLSFRARGLLAFMLSMPDHWQFYSDSLEQYSEQDGRFSVEAAVKELIDKGYISKEREKDENGRWKAPDWQVREEPRPQPGLPQPVNFEDLRFPAKKSSNQQARLDDQPQPGRFSPQPGLPRPVNHPLLKTKKRIIRRENKKETFDPEDLPTGLSKNPLVVKAWASFVQHRRELKHPLTRTSWKMWIVKMMVHPPEVIVDAIETAIERGWRGMFFQNIKKLSNPVVSKRNIYSAKLDAMAQKVHTYINSILGDGSASENDIEDLMASFRTYYRALPLDPNNEFNGPAYRLPMDTFFSRWFDFLQKKQKSGFVLQGFNQLRIGQTRWNEFIRDCERYTQYNFRTGEYQG